MQSTCEQKRGKRYCKGSLKASDGDDPRMPEPRRSWSRPGGYAFREESYVMSEDIYEQF